MILKPEEAINQHASAAIKLEEPNLQVALLSESGDNFKVKEEQVELNYLLDELKT